MLKKALKKMLKDGEFEKIIKQCKWGEKKKAKQFYEAIKDFDDKDFDRVPEIVFIQACKSYTVWQDIYCYMRLNKYEKQNAPKA